MKPKSCQNAFGGVSGGSQTLLALSWITFQLLSNYFPAPGGLPGSPDVFGGLPEPPQIANQATPDGPKLRDIAPVNTKTPQKATAPKKNLSNTENPSKNLKKVREKY